jgi:hypothetical protein
MFLIFPLFKISYNLEYKIKDFGFRVFFFYVLFAFSIFNLIETHEKFEMQPQNAVYLTNTYAKTKGIKSDLLIFKIFNMKNSSKSYLLVEVEPKPTSFQVTNIMVTRHKEKFEKIYRINLNKNLMNTQCFFAGKEIFPNSYSSNGICSKYLNN